MGFNGHPYIKSNNALRAIACEVNALVPNMNAVKLSEIDAYNSSSELKMLNK